GGAGRSRPGASDPPGAAPPRGALARRGVDVASDRSRLDRQTERVELRDPTDRAGADASPGRQSGEREAVARDERIAWILALRNRRDHQAVRGRGRQGFVGVHGDVDFLRRQRVTQRRHEYAYAEASNRLLRAIARGHDLDEFDVDSGELVQRVGDEAALRHRKRTAAGSEAKGHTDSPP